MSTSYNPLTVVHLIISHIGNTHDTETPAGNTGNGTSVNPAVIMNLSGNQIAVRPMHLVCYVQDYFHLFKL